MTIMLNAEEARVLGCLVEKSITTPDYYPLTINSLVAACNQKSNRYPVVSFDVTTVKKTIDGLRYKHHVVWEVSQAGSRSLKYKHDLAGLIGLTDAELAIMCILMLRGPQTPGEIRARALRMYAFSDVGEVLLTLSELGNQERGPLVLKLSREHGCREPRFIHLLCEKVDEIHNYDVNQKIDLVSVVDETDSIDFSAEKHPDELILCRLREQINKILSEVENLRREVDELKER